MIFVVRFFPLFLPAWSYDLMFSIWLHFDDLYKVFGFGQKVKYGVQYASIGLIRLRCSDENVRMCGTKTASGVELV